MAGRGGGRWSGQRLAGEGSVAEILQSSSGGSLERKGSRRCSPARGGAVELLDEAEAWEGAAAWRRGSVLS
ncbi:hypothetical protein GUJ93_ZPchr0001g31411 [Zizania palustris]|uniref:Uncharacterized protein n=1 Tax=Zizania palustris TaxID=103762 RepID=A0A8J5VAC1_ZIZPA|nr:hypothetical protein GUJ93_ZPchr0001g31411 [Zizania palustris]